MGRRALSQHAASICTIGAAGHGKTAVTRALLRKLNPSGLEASSVLCSRHFTFRTELRQYHHCDPAANDVAKYLADQVSGIDGTLLVVSVTDGVTAETRQHVRLTRFANVPTIIPVLNKCDLSTNQQSRIECARAIAEVLSAHDYDAFDVFTTGAYGLEERSEAPVRLLASMVDRYVRSRYD